MRLRLISFCALCSLFLFSCKSGFEYNKAGMEKLNQELKKEFGPEAWYTAIELKKDGSDDLITIDETKDPNSLQQERWVQTNGFWNKDADVTLSVQGAAPKSFMFQLDKEISLSRLGDLMETSLKKLKEEKQADDATLTLAQVQSNNRMNTKGDGIHYVLIFFSKKTGKNYNFIYRLDGSLQSLND